MNIQRASLVAQTVKNLPAMQETQVWSLGQEDSLEKRLATHFSILAWRVPWTEESDMVQSTESQRVRHDNLIKTWGQTCLLWQNKLNTRHGTQRGSVRLLDQGRLQRQNDIWQQLRGKSWWWRKQKPLKSKAGRMSRLVQEWKIKTWVVPSYHFLKSLEIPSVNSWASLLRTLAPHSTCKIPRGVPSRKFCLLLLIKCLGLCLCAPGFNQEYEYLFLCHYPVQIYVKRQWQ